MGFLGKTSFSSCCCNIYSVFLVIVNYGILNLFNMKTIVMQVTINYMVQEANAGNQDAIDFLEMTEKMNIEKKNNYVVLTEKI